MSAAESRDSIGDTRLPELMSGYQNGDNAAATALIDRVSPLLFRFFLAQVASRRSAEDLLQETWLRIHKVRHTYRPGEPVLPWIYAIARHLRVDHYRKVRRVENRELQVETLPHVAASVGDELAQSPDFETMLKALPASQREVITMMKVSGMSLEEVANATASSVGSVKQKAHRAYNKLRQLLTQRPAASMKLGGPGEL